MQGLAQGAYSTSQVRAALHAVSRRIGFRYELLTSGNVHKAELTGIAAASIANNAFADIKRTARFRIRDGTDSIAFGSDRIKPFIRLRMSSGDILEWPQGVFLLSSPTRVADEQGTVFRDVEAYDQLQVLRDDKFTDRHTVAAGANYISGASAVKAILDGAGITLQNLTATAKTLPTAKEWPPGTPKLQAINELLDAINYRSLWFDESGKAVAQPYVSPSVAAIEYTYEADKESVIHREVSETLDLFDVPNQWVLVVSEPDRDPLRSVYTNSVVSSPTSTVSRGRTITEYREGVEAPDQATLDALASRVAFEASQVYQAVAFDTAIMPHHSDSDVLEFIFSPLGVSAKFSELSWEMDLSIGGRMRHTIRRVVSV